MQAELSRKLALIMGSPLFRYQISKEPDNGDAVRDRLINDCVKADTEANLPPQIQKIFAQCEASIAEAERLKISYPYDQPGQLETIMGLDKAGDDNAN
ncbi:MAG: hypothetical protein KME27_10640 [Lyngbya sp. HA4199-MV5]|jgi:hypothetical protein|nr:hypothetical protein [Lyngbya sp. HA4199-MV5]